MYYFCSFTGEGGSSSFLYVVLLIVVEILFMDCLLNKCYGLRLFSIYLLYENIEQKMYFTVCIVEMASVTIPSNRPGIPVIRRLLLVVLTKLLKNHQ
jgi:hypothetical protein